MDPPGQVSIFLCCGHLNIVNERVTHNRPLIPDVPFHPGPVYWPPSKPISSNLPRGQEISQSSSSIQNINPDINLDFEDNSLFQEGIISKTFQRPDKSLLQKLEELSNLINTGNLIQGFLPKQADIDKILKVIQRKVLKDTHLLVAIKEIQARYLHSSYLKTSFSTCHKINCLLAKQHLEKWKL